MLRRIRIADGRRQPRGHGRADPLEPVSSAGAGPMIRRAFCRNRAGCAATRSGRVRRVRHARPHAPRREASPNQGAARSARPSGRSWRRRHRRRRGTTTRRARQDTARGLGRMAGGKSHAGRGRCWASPPGDPQARPAGGKAAAPRGPRPAQSARSPRRDGRRSAAASTTSGAHGSPASLWIGELGAARLFPVAIRSARPLIGRPVTLVGVLQRFGRTSTAWICCETASR